MLPRMLARLARRLTRNAEAPLLFESFFVAAVASFLGIRFFLAVTGYPQIGANGLHIAHMLWGGLLMLLAILLLLAFLDRSVQHASAAIAGLGFGTFIDEIGKFVTADNDYFFRPAVALIYVLFVVAFLVVRVLVGRRRLTTDEAVANALHQLAGTAGERLEPDERARIARLLRAVRAESRHAKLLRAYLDTLPGEKEHPGPVAILRRRASEAYTALMAHEWADRALTIAVVVYAVLAVAGVATVVTASGGLGDVGFVVIAEVGSTVAGAVLVGLGVASLPRSRIEAYRWFMRGILVWILITQVFVFYRSELAGLGGLAIDLVAYAALRLAITEELTHGHEAALATAQAPLTSRSSSG
jgi:ABC-type multidrug transport system fused ATPase/permease subunit